ncbi:hypothetical protein TNCV_4504451 [Trichonephila clavipes]|nr:hypothetical protein TNCV_4504451 [Trichonephila clavipes]
MILIPASMNSPSYDDFIDLFSVPTPVLPLPPTPVASPSHEPSEDGIYDSLPPMEQSTLPESPLKDLLSMEQSRVPESPLKHPVDSKPPVFSRPPVASKSSEVSKSPEVSTPVKKVDSVIHRSPRSRERRNEERRHEERRHEERRNEERRNEKRRNEERRNEKRRNEERNPRDPMLYHRPYFRQTYRRPDFKPRVFRRPPYAQQLMPTTQENAQFFFHSQGMAVLCIRNNGFTLTN